MTLGEFRPIDWKYPTFTRVFDCALITEISFYILINVLFFLVVLLYRFESFSTFIFTADISVHQL